MGGCEREREEGGRERERARARERERNRAREREREMRVLNVQRASVPNQKRYELYEHTQTSTTKKTLICNFLKLRGNVHWQHRALRHNYY